MNIRSALVALLSLFCAQATLTATTLYNQNGIFATTAATCPNCSIYPLATSDTSATPVADWTEDTNTSGTQQIDCVVAVGNVTDVCGNPGADPSATSISLYPGPSGTLPSGVNNYLMIDGDPAYGAPVSTDLTGMTIGVTYYVSFYQSSNQETSNTAPSNDNWEVFLINGADQGTPTPTNPVFTSAIMANAGKESTPWEEQTFSFVATAASETLEFLENASANTVPPMLDLADVSVTTPEPGTWVLVLVGAGLVFAGNRLRRRPSAYKPADRG